MTAKTKKKLCWNCEGNVSIQDASCPYCGVSVENTPIMGNDAVTKSIHSPYQLVNTPGQPLPSASYTDPEKEKDNENPTEGKKEPSSEEMKNITLSLILLLLGMALVIFGLILWIFSNKNGVLTLSWNSSYWFLYILIGLPMLYAGWRISSYLSEED